MNGVRELLADHPFTAGLADDDLDAMAACGRVVAVRARQRVAREGISYFGAVPTMFQASTFTP